MGKLMIGKGWLVKWVCVDSFWVPSGLQITKGCYPLPGMRGGGNFTMGISVLLLEHIYNYINLSDYYKNQ